MVRGWDEIGVCGSEVEGRLGAEGGDSDEDSSMKVSAQTKSFENFKQFWATDQKSKNLDCGKSSR